MTKCTEEWTPQNQGRECTNYRRSLDRSDIERRPRCPELREHGEYDVRGPRKLDEARTRRAE